MEQVNKYYFEVGIEFKSDYNVKNLEEVLGVKPSVLVNLKDAVGPVKTAKFIYKTKDMTEIYTDEMFEKFLIEFESKTDEIVKILKENDGEISFSVIFTRLDIKPCISLSKNAVNILSELGARVDVDFI